MLGVIVLSIPFFKFFQWDRSQELLDNGFDLTTDTSKFKAFLAIVTLISLGVFGVWAIVTRKRREKIAREEKKEEEEELIDE